ncbi:hypothetical protein GCM10027033_04530 [Leucobacter ruminantium]
MARSDTAGLLGARDCFLSAQRSPGSLSRSVPAPRIHAPSLPFRGRPSQSTDPKGNQTCPTPSR